VQPGRRDRLQRARHRRRRALGPADAGRSWPRCRCCARTATAVLADHPALAGRARRLLFETIRRMLSAQVHDVIDTTARRVAAAGRAMPTPCAGAAAGGIQRADACRGQSTELKRFLFSQPVPPPQVMRHHRRKPAGGARAVRRLPGCPAEMPPELRRSARPPRAVADYIAGMTDRFALRETTAGSSWRRCANRRCSTAWRCMVMPCSPPRCCCC
jgi:dGTP triphosphohydrolase